MGIDSIKVNNQKIITNKDLQTSSYSTASEVSIMSANNDDIKLIKLLNITQEELSLLKQKYPDFIAHRLDEQLDIVEAYRAEMRALASQNVEKQSEVDEQNNSETVTNQTTYSKFNKSEFNNMSLEEKVEACFVEFAKSQYIFGTEHDGKVISEPHSEEQWDALAPEEKSAIIEKTKTAINNDKKLEGLKGLIISETKPEDKKDIADSVMLGIQAANREGKSYLEFLHQDEYSRDDMIESYLIEIPNKDLNEYEKKYDKRWKLLGSVVTDIAANNENGNVYKIDCNQDVREYIKRNNLNEDELIYGVLKSKLAKDGKLDGYELEQYNKLKSNLETDAGKFQTQKAKAANLIKLQAQYDELDARVKKGETLDSREQGLLRDLKNTLNSKESAELRKLADNLPKPQTEKEKQVVKDIENFKEQIKDHVKGVKSEAKVIYAYIDNKTKGMTPAEKKEYIKTVLKFNDGVSASELFQMYAKKYNDFYTDKYLLDKSALNTENLTAEQTADVLAVASENKKSDDAYLVEIGKVAETTTGQKLASSECSSEIHDDKKIVYSAHTANTKDPELQKLATDVNVTIVDVEKQKDAQNKILTSENATDDVKIYTLDKLDKFHEQNRYSLLDNATNENEAATAHAAENDVISKLGKNDQTKGFKLIKNRVEDLFEGEQAIKYSKALSDQIPNCDKSNQLDMHNEIMKSKYSEVQEHAAYNINKLDPTVQGAAVESVVRSGNEKAVSLAMNSLTKAAPEVQRQQVINLAVMNSVDNNKNSESEERFKLLNSTNLTPEQFAKLSPAEKREYYKKIFDKASPGEKIEMLSKLPGNQQKTVYTIICRFFPEILSSMVESGQGEKMLQSGLPLDASNKILAAMKRSTNIEVITQLKEIKQDSAYKSFFKDEVKEERSKSQGLEFVTNTLSNDSKIKKLKSNMDLRV